MPDEHGETNEPATNAAAVDDTAQLATYLATHDLLCPVCGYNLHLIQSTRCPECGASLELRVGSSDLRLISWITSLLSFTIPLGFFAVLTVIGLSVFLRHGFHSNRDWAMIYASAGSAVVFALIVVVLIRKRRRFWKLTPRRQRLIGLLSLIVAGGALGAFLAMFVSDL